MNARRIFLIAAMLVVMLSVTLNTPARPVSQDQEGPSTVTFNMTAQHVGTGPGGQTPVIIQVTRWSSSDERDALEEIFIADGMQALAQALRDAPEVGFIRAPSIQATGWRLRYAMMYDGGNGKRIIRVATDRPISFAEAMQRRRATWDFNVTLIELVVDEDGNGEGTLMAGVEFAYDQTNDTFGLKSLSSQPVRLNNVRATFSQN